MKIILRINRQFNFKFLAFKNSKKEILYKQLNILNNFFKILMEIIIMKIT